MMPRRRWRRLRLTLNFLRWYLFGAWFIACKDMPPPAETSHAAEETVLCFARLHDAMASEHDCLSKRAKADLVAQTDPHCRAAGADLSGLLCGDGGTDGH